MEFAQTSKEGDQDKVHGAILETPTTNSSATLTHRPSPPTWPSSITISSSSPSYSSSALTLDQLPMEVLVRIFELADCFETAMAGCVLCRSIALAASDDAVWRSLGNDQWLNINRFKGKSRKQMYLDWLTALHANSSTAMTSDEERDIIVKVSVIGAARVGKSCFIKRSVYNSRMIEQYRKTHDLDFALKIIRFAGATVRVQYWDIAGAECGNTRAMRIYFKDTAGAVLMYDITDRSSFDFVEQKLLHYRNFMHENHRVMLVGNKMDLGDSERQVSREEGQAMAEKHGMLFAEVSNKTAEGVQGAVELIVQSVAVEVGLMLPRPRRLSKAETMQRVWEHVQRTQQQEKEKDRENGSDNMVNACVAFVGRAWSGLRGLMP